MPKLVNAVPKYRKHRASGQAIGVFGRCHPFFFDHRMLPSSFRYNLGPISATTAAVDFCLIRR